MYSLLLWCKLKKVFLLHQIKSYNKLHACILDCSLSCNFCRRTNIKTAIFKILIITHGRISIWLHRLLHRFELFQFQVIKYKIVFLRYTPPPKKVRMTFLDKQSRSNIHLKTSITVLSSKLCKITKLILMDPVVLAIISP